MGTNHQNSLFKSAFRYIDMFQHVNNVSQQMYFDLGKADFTGRSCRDDVLSGTSRIITAATANSFKEQIRMEGRLSTSRLRSPK